MSWSWDAACAVCAARSNARCALKRLSVSCASTLASVELTPSSRHLAFLVAWIAGTFLLVGLAYLHVVRAPGACSQLHVHNVKMPEPSTQGTMCLDTAQGERPKAPIDIVGHSCRHAHVSSSCHSSCLPLSVECLSASVGARRRDLLCLNSYCPYAGAYLALCVAVPASSDAAAHCQHIHPVVRMLINPKIFRCSVPREREPLLGLHNFGCLGMSVL